MEKMPRKSPTLLVCYVAQLGTLLRRPLLDASPSSDVKAELNFLHSFGLVHVTPRNIMLEEDVD